MGRAGRALERARPRICRGADQVPALHGPAPAALEPLPRGLFLPPEPAGLHLARPRARRRRRRLRGVHPRCAQPRLRGRPGQQPTARGHDIGSTAVGAQPAACLRQTGARSLLVTGIGGALDAPLGAAELTPTRHDFARARGRLPEERFDAVLAAGIFERIPGADANWVLRELFAAADRALVLRVGVIAREGVGSEGWWRRRVEAIAAHHPTVSWELDAVRRLPTGCADGRGDAGPARRAARKPAGLGAHRRRRGSRPPGAPGRRGAGRAVRREAAGVRAARGPARPGASAPPPAASMPAGSAALAPPWPDVLITSGQRSAPVARWIRAPVRRPHPAGAAGPARRPVRALRPDRGHAGRPAADPQQRPPGGGTAERGAGVASTAAAATRDGAHARVAPRTLPPRRAGGGGIGQGRERARSPAWAAGSPSPPTQRSRTGCWRHCVPRSPARSSCWTAPRTRAPRCSAAPTGSSSPPAMARCWPKPP